MGACTCVSRMLLQTGWIHDVVRKSKRLKLKQWVWQGIAPREARRWRGGDLTAEFHDDDDVYRRLGKVDNFE